MTPAHFERLATLLKDRSGLALGKDKLYLLETRLAAVMKRERLRNLDALAERLAAGASEALARDVVEAMTTNETLFFRDGKPFDHLRTEALAKLHAVRPPGTKLRIWSAATASGQEAYSLAMTAAELAPALAGRTVEILGTDIAREPLERARSGVYSQFEIQRGLPMQMLVRYFRKEADGWRAADAIRSMVQFREWNLLDDLRPLGMFDVIFCRNVLIYFDAPAKARVLEAMARQLAPGGLLYLGGAETMLGLATRFSPLPAECGVYSLGHPPTMGSSARAAR